MMKITQLLTNMKLWQSTFVAFVFLFSLSMNSQDVGDDVFSATNGMLSTLTVDATGGVDGSGTGCSPCGWATQIGAFYAPSNSTHGDVHSVDRMFKFGAGNGYTEDVANAQIVAQEFSLAAAGTYTLTFYHKWVNAGGVDYDAGDGPQLSLKKANASGEWENLQVNEVPLSNIGVGADWTEMSVTYEVAEAGDYRLQIYKAGGNAADPTNMYGSLLVDSFTFVYTAAAASGPTPVTAPWSDDFEDADASDWSAYSAGDDSTQGWILANGSSIVMYHADDSGSIDNYIISPLLDTSGLTAPLLTFSETGSYQSYYTRHSVVVSTDYDGTNAATATWSDLYEGAAPTSMTEMELALPNNTTAVAFRYEGNYSDTWQIDDVSVTETPTNPAMEVTATTSGSSATFSFTIDNFTVGGDDGHIHYSLNGGEEVMVYSSDDLTLSDLPNGDHTIVFSLVDAGHQALDPAVTSTVNFSTFDGTVACGETASICYDSTNSTELWFTSTAAEGQVASVTFTGAVENGYDYVVITNGAGTQIGEDLTGDLTGVTVDSDDNGLMVYIQADGSWSCQSGQSGSDSLDATVSCATPQADVTFTVNTANITVGENGMYLGGGVFETSNAHLMSDEDGDGTYEVTVAMDIGTTGNYIFFNSPDGGGDWGSKENLTDLECGDPANYWDRILPAIDGDMTIQHCYGSCESDGSCPDPLPAYDVTFSVNMSNYPGGLMDTDVVNVNGTFNSWCGGCNPMSDEDGDGVYELTIPLNEGDYEYKFTVNGWSAQEVFSEAIEGCAVDADNDGQDINRPLALYADTVLDTVYWNLCAGEVPGVTYDITFNLDATAIEVGENGMYMGGGFLGNDTAVQMLDEDADGIWTATIPINEDQIGSNYTFLNSPQTNGGWNSKEDISGQECADAANNNDRKVLEFSGDTTFCFVFAVCTDGTCAEPADGMMMLQGILDLDVPSAGSDGKALHLLVTEDIADLTSYGIGVANNGGGTDGEEYTFPEGSATAGMHILVARSAEAMEAYGITGFDMVLDANTDISQNGDDAIELYFGGDVIETFGEIDVDGTNEAWEYADSWAYMVDGAWTYGGVDCSDDTTTTCESSCPYPFTDCGSDAITGSWCEDFDGEAFPAEGWISYRGANGLGELYDWEASSTYAVSGANSAHVRYENVDGGLAEDWLVTPMFVPDASNNHISFSHRQAYTSDYGSTYDVRVSTASNDSYDDFTVLASWTEADFEAGEFTSIEFSLADYLDTPIYVAFVMTNDDGDDWYIDDVCVQAGLSINENEILDMKIYPNPVDGNFVTIQSPVQGVKEIQVYTVTGRLLMNTAINGETLDVSSFNSGFYMLKVTINGQTKVSKLVVR